MSSILNATLNTFGTLQAPATNGQREGNLKLPFFFGLQRLTA